MMARVMGWIIAMVLAAAVTSSANEPGFRPRIACVPFMATSLQAMAFTENISVSLLNNIDKSNAFEVVERKKIEQFLELEGFRLDNLDNDSLVRIGRKAGLDFIVYGSVNSADSGVELNANMLNVRTGKVVLQEKIRITESDFSRLLADIAGKIVDRAKTNGKPVLTLERGAVATIIQPPANLSASGTPNCIKLAWQCPDIKQIAGFNVYRSSNINGPYNQHASTVAPSYVDEQLRLNEEFYYRVAAVSLAGRTSEMTPPVRGATAIAPPAPILMNAVTDIKGARIAWHPRHMNGNTDKRMMPNGFKLYRSQGVDGVLKPVATLTVDSLQFSDTSLADGVKYCYTVTAFNSDNAESENSSKLCVAPLSSPKALKAVSNMIRHVALSWEKYGSDAAEGYAVYRSDKKDGKSVEIARIDGLDKTSYVDHDLPDKSEYWYRISVYSKSGAETDQSAAVSAITRDVPPAPQKVSAQSGQPRRVTLRWQLSGTPDDEIRSVLVYRSVTGRENEFEKIADISSEKNEYLDNENPLADKSTYYYRLAVQNSGKAASKFSDMVSATTKPAPAAPANFKAASGEVKKISLRWDKNPETDIKTYQIFRKRADDADFSQIHDTAENSFVDSSLADGSDVSYKLLAVDKDGLVSRFSDLAVARTKPLPLKVSGIKKEDAAKRIISWQPNREKDVKSYNVYNKGFLGIAEKLATVNGTRWKSGESKGKMELFVTAVDETGLESEPSETVIFE